MNIKKGAFIFTGVVPFLAVNICISYILETPRSRIRVRFKSVM
ncbi:hypothetical protein LEP1GSC125_2718 [Leptospira mayottensis 200901122]|uniref:Uncharacterized protein n=1 Tax=Leptospira mayottensis 200901122 TaxID=1193010 RepID=A0AA87MNV6_9LEPT|nr:hypothetical protein LEP1GSC125_2718 [Leptospira mayottensis 200901122]